jgi:hypothetical protein
MIVVDANQTQVKKGSFEQGDASRIGFGHKSIPHVKDSVLCSGHSSKCNNYKLRQDRVNVLCTADLPNEIYLSTKFHVNI